MVAVDAVPVGTAVLVAVVVGLAVEVALASVVGVADASVDTLNVRVVLVPRPNSSRYSTVMVFEPGVSDNRNGIDWDQGCQLASCVLVPSAMRTSVARPIIATPSPVVISSSFVKSNVTIGALPVTKKGRLLGCAPKFNV